MRLTSGFPFQSKMYWFVEGFFNHFSSPRKKTPNAEYESVDL